MKNASGYGGSTPSLPPTTSDWGITSSWLLSNATEKQSQYSRRSWSLRQKNVSPRAKRFGGMKPSTAPQHQPDRDHPRKIRIYIRLADFFKNVGDIGLGNGDVWNNATAKTMDREGDAC